MRVEAILHRLSGDSSGAQSPLAQMLEDSHLPADIRPEGRCGADTRYILLTGATGFLGAFLLRTLLENTGARVCCLVRDGPNVAARVRANLQGYGIWDEGFTDRIDVVAGRLDHTCAGMAPEDYSALSESVDAIYHCGAAVNWIYPYRKLARVNVRGTVELLRFACLARPKAFHFISSSAVCYSTMGPRSVDEHTDMAPYMAGMSLGYAQTKCVAESLVRQAGERGLSISIHRPALLSGDSRTGQSNLDDFLCRFVKGCIVLGSAPELDWRMDCCPVDFAAESIVRLSPNGHHQSSFHLMNPFGRCWRECILWINFFGYPVRLLPYRVWLDELRQSLKDPDQPLRELAPFFCREVPSQPGVYLPQLYEETRNGLISSAATHRTLNGADAFYPRLNAELFDRYFESFIATGYLSAPRARRRSPSGLSSEVPPAHLDAKAFTDMLGMKVRSATPARQEVSHSLITELTSWRFKNSSGLFRYALELEQGVDLDVMAKRKPTDAEVLEVAEEIAGLCGEELGMRFAEIRDGMEFVNCHRREPAVYRQRDPRFRNHAPAFYGAAGNTLFVEYLADAALIDTADDVSGWTRADILAVLDGAASLHAIWFGRRNDLFADERIGPTLVTPDVQVMTPFWVALAAHARPLLAPWLGKDIGALQDIAISSLGDHNRLAAQLPGTLIHNDFNPRNVALRPIAGTLRLCAYDWEMARFGLPQHDLAEMLCFVLPPDTARDDVLALSEFHRGALERASGLSIAREDWLLGFRLSLLDLLVNRLAMYAMVYRFRRLPYLERALLTWRRLHAMLFAMGSASLG
jgi:thioester reductase-like protein